MTRLVLLVVAVASAALARHAYELPGDAETILTAPLQTTFSCEGRRYGYYADADNNCEVFHVCLPIADEEGNTLELAHFTFVCGNRTVFNQETLTCTSSEDSMPCAESPNFYDIVNSEFGVVREEDVDQAL